MEGEKPYSVWRQSRYKREANAKRQKKKSHADPETAVQKEQSERFIESARQLDADETGASFQRALDVVLPLRKKGP